MISLSQLAHRHFERVKRIERSKRFERVKRSKRLNNMTRIIFSYAHVSILNIFLSSPHSKLGTSMQPFYMGKLSDVKRTNY